MKPIRMFNLKLGCIVAVWSLCFTWLPTCNAFYQVSSEEPAPLAPAQALKQFEVSEGFELQLVLSEPQISQPAFFNFDERGRLWVMNYLQYPNPAGLKMLSRDKHWRAVYDKIPTAPPNHVRGADKITIHEDTNGDGAYDSHKTFVDGLSIATSFVRGRGGVWVLNPPYLLFYPDRDNDDIPDGDPEVHLEGFGIQDTHSCANSLRWGPDGWLYAGQGSTVTGNIRKPGEKNVVHSLGQLIWRYHPETQTYEIFAEGGGNTFGVEFDSDGRVFSGHNGGDTRGFHYVQGGYYQKGFGKHGPLSNPFAFGYFPAMKHHKVARFVHNFVIYESTEFPEAYRGDLYGVEPMQGQIVRADLIPNGTSFETNDLERIVKTDDKWFRPVDIKAGPDGAIYFADFYEPQISHREHFEGQIDKERGRIYRLAPTSLKHSSIDMGKLDAQQLAAYLTHPNKWYRQTALRRLYDLKDPGILPELEAQALAATGSLDQLWAINASGGSDYKLSLLNKMIYHSSPKMREWAVRLLFDSPEPMTEVTSGLSYRIRKLASEEIDPHVRSQLICSTRRMPNELAIDVIQAFLNSSQSESDEQNLHIPLLVWWALESQCTKQPAAVIPLIEDESLIWNNELFKSILAERLMRRFALAGTRQDYQFCTELFKMAPDKDSQAILFRGFELAFKGRSMTGLPTELTQQLALAGGDSLTFQLRQLDPVAIEKANSIIENTDYDLAERLSVIETFGEIDIPSGDVLVHAIDDPDETIQIAGLHAAKRFANASLAKATINGYSKMSPDVQEVAQSMLASRSGWTLQFLTEIENKTIDATTVSQSMIRKMAIHGDKQIAEILTANWKDFEGISSEKIQREIRRVSDLIRVEEHELPDPNDPMTGKLIFTERCAKCHQMFGEGGSIGPDLTTYDRSDATNILINIVNPNAEIREGFENYKILTLDGQIVLGFITDQDNKVIVVRGADGQSVTLERDEIDDMAVQKVSLMPEGLLDDLSDRQLRDLFAYIRSSQPLNQ